jgi:hypothetical protein
VRIGRCFHSHAYRATRGRRFPEGGGPAHFPTANRGRPELC